MVLPNNLPKVVSSLWLGVLSSLFFIPQPAPAQTGSPLPGSATSPGLSTSSGAATPTAGSPIRSRGGSGADPSGLYRGRPQSASAGAPGGYNGSAASGAGGAVAPARATSASYSAPIPGTPATLGPAPGAAVSQFAAGRSYDRLPLNAVNAQARLDELQNLMPHSRPKEFQDAIGEYCDWLQDMADAHWKLSQTFGKDGMKAQSDAERQDCIKFGQLRRQAMLLKAQFLIAQRRYPEALGPLVEIVVAEPKTETGHSAYRLLQEIGFSHDAIPAAVPAAGT